MYLIYKPLIYTNILTKYNKIHITKYVPKNFIGTKYSSTLPTAEKSHHVISYPNSGMIYFKTIKPFIRT